MTSDLQSDRRTVLKTLGTGILAGSALVGTAQAGDPGNNRRQNSFAWAQNDLYEMLEPEPDPADKESEGNENAHRPLWVIASMAGTGVDGAEHSPHPNPDGLPIDHVVPLVDFSAQWHVHLVLDQETPFVDHDDDPDTDVVPNFVNQVGGTHLTSATAITNNQDKLHILPTDTVFTCPIRPHQHDRGNAPARGGQ